MKKKKNIVGITDATEKWTRQTWGTMRGKLKVTQK